MKYEKLMTTLSKKTRDELEAYGIRDFGMKDCLLVAFSVGVPAFTRHGGTLPYPIGLMSGIGMSAGDISYADYKTCEKETDRITFRDGRTRDLTVLKCPAEFKKDDGRARLVILPHGFGVVKTYMVRYVKLYWEHGFDCVWYDHRGHGKALKENNSMGWYEAKDLEAVAAFYRENLGKDAIIGIHGESMGSAIAYQALEDTVNTTDFTVCDCGYSDMGELATWIEKLFFMFPKDVLGPLVNDMSEVDGVRFTDTRPIDKVAACPADYPIFFIQGGGDFFVPTHMTKDMYEVKQGKKKLKIYGKAFHACSQLLYLEEYKKDVADFLAENDIA